MAPTTESPTHRLPQARNEEPLPTPDAVKSLNPNTRPSRRSNRTRRSHNIAPATCVSRWHSEWILGWRIVLAGLAFAALLSAAACTGENDAADDGRERFSAEIVELANGPPSPPGAPEPSSPSEGGEADADARDDAATPGGDGIVAVTITQRVVAGGYIAGSLGFFELDGESVGFSMDGAFETRLDSSIEVELLPGRYKFASWQQPCSGNCDFLDEPTDGCDAQVEVEPSAPIAILVEVRHGIRCVITIGDSEDVELRRRPAGLDAWPNLASCGAYTNRNQPPAATPGQRRANRCITRAAQSGKAGEVFATYVSVEGDPIDHYIRVLDQGRIEWFLDTRADTFGSQEWTHRLCENVRVERGVLRPFGCKRIPLEKVLAPRDRRLASFWPDQAPASFTPVARREGTDTIVPFAFPDGTSYEIVWRLHACVDRGEHRQDLNALASPRLGERWPELREPHPIPRRQPPVPAGDEQGSRSVSDHSVRIA